MYVCIYNNIHMDTSVSSNRVKMRNAVVMLTLNETFTLHNIKSRNICLSTRKVYCILFGI